MNPNKIKALLKRELTDIFRDKKTLCMMVLLPLLLYPLMIVGMTLLFSAITQSQEETTYQVAFADLGQEREQTLTDLLEKDADTFSYQISVEPFDENDKTIEQALKDGDYDAVLSYEESQKDPYRIYYLEAKDDSGIAAAALKELLEDYNKQLQKQKVQQLGLDADEILNPVRYEEADDGQYARRYRANACDHQYYDGCDLSGDRCDCGREGTRYTGNTSDVTGD